MKIFNQKNISWIWDISIGLLGFILILITSSKYGLGISGDGIHYIAAADSFVEGIGFISYDGKPLISWPPLYSAFIGWGSVLFNSSVLVFTRYFHATLFFITIILSGKLIRLTIPNRALWIIFAELMLISSRSFISLYANVATEPLFIVWLFVFLILCIRYLDSDRTESMKYLIWMGVLSAFVPLLRYTGTLFIVISVSLIFWRNKGDWMKAVQQSFIFGILSIIPLGLLIMRNYSLSNTLVGPRSLSRVKVWENLKMFTELIGKWYVPEIFILVFYVGLAALFVYYLVNLGELKQIGKKLTTDKLFPVSFFTIIYFLFVLLTTFTDDHKQYFYDDRYLVELYIPFLIVFFITIEIGLFAKEKFNKNNILNFGLLFVFGVGLVFQGLKINKYILASLSEGVVYYNIYNTSRFHDDGILTILQEYPFEQNAYIYSNHAAAVYLFSPETTARPSPSNFQDRAPLPEYYQANYSNWPEQEHVYLLWFLPNEKEAYYPPNYLDQVVDIELIREEESYQFFRIK